MFLSYFYSDPIFFLILIFPDPNLPLRATKSL
jgi:hypothetical protein